MSMRDNFESLQEQIKNFDFSEVQWESFGTWPLFLKVGAWLLAFLIVLGAGYAFVIDSAISERASVIRKEQDLRRDFEKKVDEAANLEAYRAQMKEIEAAFSALLSQLPGETEVPGLLEDITEKGVNSGLDFKLITLLSEKAAAYYVEQPISIEATGSYHDMGAFVSGVASLPRIVTLNNFSLKPVGGSGGSSLLSLKIDASTYRYKETGK